MTDDVPHGLSRRELLGGLVALGLGTPPLPASRASARHRTTAPGAPPVEVLAFDVFGTVVDWRSNIIAEGERLGAAMGLRVDWAAFADDWRRGYFRSIDRVRRGELPWTTVDVLHRMVLDELLARYRVGDLSEAEEADFNRAWHRLRPWPDAVAGLTRLRRRFVVTTLSNGNVALLTRMAKYAGLPWDCVLSAELVRHYKGDPEVYRMVAELFDLRPDQVLMVAAHPGDLRAARRVGLRTAFVTRPLQHWERARGAAVRPGEFDLVARDFLDLAAHLGL